MKSTADVTGGKPIAVLLQSISGVSAINPLVAFYDIHGGKREAILLFCPGHHSLSARRTITEAKKCSQRPVIGWVTKISSFFLFRIARLLHHLLRNFHKEKIRHVLIWPNDFFH
jgi:hypothetical protein